MEQSHNSNGFVNCFVHANTHTHLNFLLVTDVQMNIFVDIVVFTGKFKNHILMYDTP
jgi:hypothetical protein